LTPAPSSDGPELEINGDVAAAKASSPPSRGLPSPVSADERQTDGLDELNARGTPSRRVMPQTGRLFVHTAKKPFCRPRRRRSATSSRTAKALTVMMCSNPLPWSLAPPGLQRDAELRIVPTRMSMSRKTRRWQTTMVSDLASTQCSFLTSSRRGRLHCPRRLGE
jgi:hypothetical protein